MSSLQKVVNKIQKRLKPSDRFYTPECVVDRAIEIVELCTNTDAKDDDIWYEPFKGLGAYYDKFPVDEQFRRWTEIDFGLDFFKFNEKVDVICTNPPYSLLTPVFKHCAKLRPRVINLLIGTLNLTRTRMNIMADAGYIMTYMHLLEVKGWFGCSIIIQYELEECIKAPACDCGEYYGTAGIGHTKNMIKHPDGGLYGAALVK